MGSINDATCARRPARLLRAREGGRAAGPQRRGPAGAGAHRGAAPTLPAAAAQPCAGRRRWDRAIRRVAGGTRLRGTPGRPCASPHRAGAPSVGGSRTTARQHLRGRRTAARHARPLCRRRPVARAVVSPDPPRGAPGRAARGGTRSAPRWCRVVRSDFTLRVRAGSTLALFRRRRQHVRAAGEHCGGRRRSSGMPGLCCSRPVPQSWLCCRPSR